MLLLALPAFGLLLTLPASAGDARKGDPWFRSGHAAVEQARSRIGPTAPARNVILFLGDGMGMSTITAARILAGQQAGNPGEEHRLSFERFPHVGLVKTYNTNQQVPDSAGTMTAIASGVKTKAGVLGVGDAVVFGDWASVAPARVPTLFEEAENRGLATGIVTTARITHATPAACYGHAADRSWETDSLLSQEARKHDFPDLARQLVEFPAGDGIDVVMGGGRAMFLPVNSQDPELPEASGMRFDERDLMAEWQERHPLGRTIWNQAQFDTVDPRGTRKLLGLFDPSHMDFELDRSSDKGGEPSLSEMTGKAIDILRQNDNGYLLLVEGGRIDHAHHANNAHRALIETVEFARAVQVALDRTDRADTLIVVTADHSHPLTLAGYVTRGNPILGKARVNPLDGGSEPELARDGAGQPYATLSYSLGPGNTGATELQPAGPKQFPHFEAEGFEPAPGRPDLTEIDTTAPGYLQEALIPRSSGTHSGEDVPVFATGPGAALFFGVQEQHYLYHAMVEAMARPADE
ncbi:MAG: alkaline phosphatase [bacterium]|nr:alkaline phosphatase [bacterium]MCP5067988.1 alkaline phosphatase [bacterium]